MTLRGSGCTEKLHASAIAESLLSNAATNCQETYLGSIRRSSLSKHVLVAGGAGFIGSTLVDALLERNNHVICYGNFGPYYGGKELNFKHNLENPSYEFLRSDILEGAMMKKAANDVDVIFHLLAFVPSKALWLRRLKGEEVITSP
jgi:FlaA1/EpsC-like NDP-sugar epimerase